MDISFTGKRALVTGAGKGIGRDIAVRLAACGAKVVAVSRTQADLDSLHAEVPSIETLVVDVGNWPSAKQRVESLGHFDLLVNSAGVSGLTSFLETKEEDIDFHMNINFKGLFNVSQTVAKSMVEKKTGGAIVNLSSVASTLALKDHASYCSSKGAVDALTKVMALELGPHKIRTNAVNPTVVMTEMGKHAWSDPAKAGPLLSRIPMGRFGEVEEVTNCVLFLLSDKASYLNGVTLPIEGGLVVA